MSQREVIVEDVNDEPSTHHEAPPPTEGRGRGRSDGSNRGRVDLEDDMLIKIPRNLLMKWRGSVMVLDVRGRQVGALPLDWGEFKKDLLERFLPKSVREARAREFLLFKQTSKIIVAEHRLTSTFIPSNGITNYRFASYVAALDCATRIEMREQEVDDATKKRKRGGEDRHGSSSTGGFSKGTKAYIHQRFSQSPSGLSTPSYVRLTRQRTDS
ncbi:DNA/RNA polymerases superfamily protein [Senna tora]|uniref:DNA/RNA polymerases superfamily protein n=1 Tax=Senna tora TaxID=362788 RepID=A0A834TU78_9FABA|nr:DNA/RNA polymerases superfamily protein [Senna tora]